MIACAIDLDLAVAQVIDFVNPPDDALNWGNTVLIVVADHATGYMRLAPDKTLGKGDLPTQTCTAGCVYPDGEVSYGTGGHSNELAHVAVLGRMGHVLRDEGTRSEPCIWGDFCALTSPGGAEWASGRTEPTMLQHLAVEAFGPQEAFSGRGPIARAGTGLCVLYGRRSRR